MVSALDKDDVLTEILLRLPAKSLMRFKSVSKKWLSLVSSDCFRHQHTLRHPKSQPSLILQYWDDRSDPIFHYWNGENVMTPYTLTRPHRHSDYRILQACNGLLLLVGVDFNFSRYVYCVYNPTTKLSTEINIPPYHDEDHYLASLALAFDPSKSPYYKIACITCCSRRDDDTNRVEVYDSESHSWELRLGPFTLPSGFCYSRYDCCEAQYWNNAIYWWRSHDAALCCFDVAKHEMREMYFPESHLGVVFDHSYLQELDGRLCYLTLSFQAMLGTLSVAVWELGGDGNSPEEWVLKHDHVFITREGSGECVGLMGDSDENLVVLIYHQSCGKMRAYNFLDKSSEELVDFKAPPFGYKYDDAYHLNVFRFGETLALV